MRIKLLKDYTDVELTEPGHDDKHQLFLVECADRGIALPASVPTFMASPEDRDDLKPDTTVYRVGNLYGNVYYFSTIEEAQDVASLVSRTAINVSSDYRSHGDNIYHIIERDRDLEVSPMQVYSTDKYDEFKGELDQYNKQKESVDKNNTRRSQILEQHTKLMSEIDDAIYEAQRNVTRLQEFYDILKQYLEMANNDHSVAVRFLLNAHYSEVTEYDDTQLEKIGLSRADINKYNEESKPAEELAI
jgi:hypothetical protein